VISKLQRLRDDKAAGADDLVPRFLNKIKGDISYQKIISFLFLNIPWQRTPMGVQEQREVVRRADYQLAENAQFAYTLCSIKN